MGSIVSLPVILLINKLIKLNQQINGRWFAYIVELCKLLYTKREKRLNVHNVWLNDVRHQGIACFDDEWTFARPSKRSEDIFIYGVNSSQQTLSLSIKWRPNNSDNKVTAGIKFRIDDNDGNYYTLDEQTEVEFRDNEYKACGLAFEVLSAFRRYRLKFRGYLKKNGKQLVYVKIRFLWIALSKVYDFRYDFDNNFLAKELANSQNSIDLYLEDRFEQFGQMKGTFKVENETEKVFYLWSCNAKKYLAKSMSKKRVIRICGYNKKGLAFHIGILINSNGNVYRFGYLFPVSGRNFTLTELSLTKSDFESLSKDSSIKFNAKFGEKEIDVEIVANNGLSHKLMINGHEGMCFINRESDDEFEKYNSNQKCVKSFTDKSFALSLTEEPASSVEISGGKGSSLAKLMLLSNELVKENSKQRFSVPKGIVVTTNAYNELLNQTALETEIIKLEKLAFSESRVNLKTDCENLVNLIANHKMPENIELKIKEKLRQTFGDIECKLFAVRSSAAGEDSEEMSAAGQMTTYLGVKGIEEIIKSVMKCWSSQFAFIAVEYRRGYGQLINSAMAIVIQEMVDCDSAGVIFTCDPNTGDERQITVSANYGLGETVVSATADPDTYILSVNINANSLSIPRNIDKIESKQIGSKRSVLRLGESGGTVEQEVIDRNSCCISDNDLLCLGEIAVKIHSHYGNARDIEWGVKGNQIVILQSRPITNLDNSYTEYEIMHEMDSPHNSEFEIYSRAHWGQNFPGSSSWNLFTWTFRNTGAFLRNLIQQGKADEKDYNPYVPGMGCCYNQLMFNLTNGIFGVFAGYPKNKMAYLMVLAFFGHEIDDKDLLAVWDERARVEKKMPLKSKLQMLLNIPDMLFFAQRRLFHTINEYMNVKKFDYVRDMSGLKTSKEILSFIDCNQFGMEKVMRNHGPVSFGSSFKNQLLRRSLESAQKSKNIVDSDFNLLISSCNNVVSAEVPNQLREIAKSIDDKESFKNLSEDEAMKLLINGTDEASQKFRQFLAKHGHRGYRESDPLHLPWADNPLPCVKTIKATLIGGELALKEKPSKSIDEVMSELQTPLPIFRKLLIKKLLLPMSRNGVGYREHSKNFMVWMKHKLNKAFWYLARHMASEGLIPDAELFFFLTADEVRILCDGNRDPLIVSRAKLRKRMYPKMDRYKFEEIIKGPEMKPRNLELDIPKIDASSNGYIRMTGTPISNGKVKARVCVAEDITDADHIQFGDILVTYSTDIGWSPYFPLISGIVTEIGGTISHGAVIAREYGIPCLIAVESACRSFKTGDICVLDTETAQIYTIC